MSKVKIGVIGLGYVGLPLVIEFSKHYEVVGFDIDEIRVVELMEAMDRTGEVTTAALMNTTAVFSSDTSSLDDCNIYIITVPTPVNDANQPDLTPLIKASETVGKRLDRNDLVIYESTVYPGATEEVCVPVLEQYSGMVFGCDHFYVGYSPERINPGDPERDVTNITKIVSASTSEALIVVKKLYEKIVTVGVHEASSIKVAEAAKVIENTQRDVNIALINELAMIFHELNIDTEEVLKAAGTKWNFLPFRPGLVGGHCIGVDPYYLTYKAQQIGYHPQIILAGRRVNDGMGSYVTSEIVKGMSNNRQCVADSRILILGYTFKENCPDIRNTRVIDIITELQEYGAICEVYDPVMDFGQELPSNVTRIDTLEGCEESYDAIVLTVAHDEFKEMGAHNIYRLGMGGDCLVFDVKNMFDKYDTDWRL